MKLFTEVKVQSKEPKIDYYSEIFLIGSCFVNNIGEKLDYYQFQNYRNPFGIVFHPVAISKFLQRCAQGYIFSETDVLNFNDQWLSFQSHSETSKQSKEEIISFLNQEVSKAREFISKSTHIIITLGTAWVYEKIESGEMVMNCHKIPSNQFKKRILSASEIKKSYQEIIASIRKVNPNAEIIFTISPIRHIKDGLVENNRSKGLLISTLHEFLENVEGGVSYFPAYEIVMDELRDYRFYNEDLVHPSTTAIEIVWNKFLITWISQLSVKIMEDVEAVQKGLLHKPFNEDSKHYKAFKRDLENKINTLKMKFPHMDFNQSIVSNDKFLGNTK